ncbi:MAG: hypothetical protein COX70_09860 [Flavobacteriales bacterium CG_4_10_14_0_2_um_filter_32_8]|nr:MAG: hypothetical protein COX70_09860 [Flavobacteriales bacterium CG_4_10_14_0_2_um_filter_32_8]PJB14703.1 MAG: hypothetical protein CO118_07205 [Flavobacteriales bacterium CG_4_9_14_3_um_filter_32_8]
MIYHLPKLILLLFYLFLLTCPIFLIAQDDKLEHVVFEEEFKKSFHAKPKLDVKFDNRFSFIRDSKVKTIGVKIGLSYRRKFKIGLGINSMLLPVQSTYTTDADTAIPVNLEYFYFSPYIEYVYYNTKKWEFSLSAQMGIGSASYQYDDVNGKKVKLNESAVLSYEPAMLIDYKIIRWIGIGTGVGYRLVFYKSPGIKEKFSSPEYVIKLKIYLGEIVRTFTGKEIQAE